MLVQSLLWSMATATTYQRYGQPTLNFDFPSNPKVERFVVHVHDSFLYDTLQKVRSYRPTHGLSSDWDIEGPPAGNLTGVAEYWVNEYDWKNVEKRLNENFDHYVTTVPGGENYPYPIPLHFIHHVSANASATPLLLLHGWPSTNLEWSKVINPLSGNSEQPFHIVAPDLPGFGFSPEPEHPGLGLREMGLAFDTLMHQLGYEKYGIVTTDLGWVTGMWMTIDVRDSILGQMCDFFIAEPTTEDRARLEQNQTTGEETLYMKSIDKWFSSHWAYSVVHSQKPLTISQALADSPVGLLGWFWDVNYATSNGYPYTEEELITDAMMMYIPGPYAGIRAYLGFQSHFPHTDVPTGVSQWSMGDGPFPDVGNFGFAPRDWIERSVNLVYFQRHQVGGHFPAVSQPDLWMGDVRAFFSALRMSSSVEKDEL
ncbi:epoxide hydrolase [Colletotrichum scovillei]|uniref:Epoxide hydrolase n=1 Tax=Colletotrichum scovillei TaxID=1209932 RepID=A0A9P7R9P6_9PEZI|nr:epoxide hydrolase [Colletotrichum scovillei]KAG7071309.1 epoxide hydrolase [Colletotrichum scovillei]KAG7079528.1 epoxide hydrolase [Colletotrichum scovillei]